MSQLTDILNKIRTGPRDADGAVGVSTKEVAILLRDRLKKHFPGTKFSVTIDGNSIDVRWEDGPTRKSVESVADQYSFGGFDGMIDLAYSYNNWFLPDGSMQVAASNGTERSMGVVPGVATDCPMPGAVLLKYGPRYVFCHRHESEAWCAKWSARLVGHVFDGIEFNPNAPLHSQHFGGTNLHMWALRQEQEEFEATQRRAAKPRIRIPLEVVD